MQDVSVYQYGLRFLSVSVEYYTEACGYLLFYCAALLFIYLKGEKREREIFLPAALLLLLTVYNPLFPMLINRFFDINQEYYRLFWITPVGILLPYLTVRIVETRENLGSKWVAAVSILLLFSLTGRFIYAAGYPMAETNYNVPKGIVELSKALHSCAETKNPKVMLEYEYNMMMRQYDPSILLTVDRETYISGVFYPISEEQMEQPDKGLQFRLIDVVVRGNRLERSDFLEALEGTKTEFIVISNGNLIKDYLVEAGLTEAARTKSHIIYQYPLTERDDPYDNPYLNDIYTNL